MQAATVWATLLVIITELLSVPSLVTVGWLTLAWSVVCVLGIFCLSRVAVKTTPAPATAASPSNADRALLIPAALLLAAVGVLAVVAPPNTWDAMEYHLPRMILWVSNHNVRLFPTANYAQLTLGPAAEYGMLHVYLLWGGDRLVNLINFFSFVGAVIAASLVAQQLGAGIRGQVLTGVFVATIPEAVLEASGAMNTVGGAFWVVTAAYFVLAFAQDSGWVNSIFAGLAVGMALVTKGTAYIYLPLVLLACWWMGSSGSRLRMLRRLPVLALIVLALNAPQMWRAYQLTGSPLGVPFPDGGPGLHYMTDRITVGSVTANVIRSCALHMDTPSQAINGWTERVIRRTIRLIGQDPDDPATTWPNRSFSTNRRSLHEIYAGNPIHLALIAVAFLLVMTGFRNVADRKLRWYVAGVLSAFVLFCALIRWTEWGSRYHLPFFFLSAPVLALVAERLLSKRAALVLGLLLLLSAVPFVFSNKIRSYIPWSRVVDIYRPRAELYFADMHLPFAPAYQRIQDIVRSTGCQDVGIESYVPVPAAQIVSSPGSFYVYPLFAMLGVDGTNLRVRFVGVQNLSAKFAPPNPPAPCVLVCLECGGHPQAAAPYVALGGHIISVDHHQILTFDKGVKLPDETENRH